MRSHQEPPVLTTASWFTKLPHGYVRIGISRGPLPPGVDLNTMRHPALTPNHARTGTPPELFHRLYVNRLEALDPEFVLVELQQMAHTRIPVLCAWTTPDSIASGRSGCHRHLAADWFERALDIQVPELGAPRAFDRFTYWRMHPLAPSIPGDRPRTHRSVPDKQSARALRRLAQGRFKF